MLPVGNAAFFIYLPWFFSPLLPLLIVLNLIIDALVLLLGYKLFRIKALTGISATDFLLKTVFKVLFLGFVADIIGVLAANMAFAATPSGYVLYEAALAAVAVVVAGVMIYLLNSWVTFGFLHEHLPPSPQHGFEPDKRPITRFCLLLAIVTAPWTLFIPFQWLQAFTAWLF